MIQAMKQTRGVESNVLAVKNKDQDRPTHQQTEKQAAFTHLTKAGHLASFLRGAPLPSVEMHGHADNAAPHFHLLVG
jgi:hypothetical protein